jgi:hypothetical protein
MTDAEALRRWNDDYRVRPGRTIPICSACGDPYPCEYTSQNDTTESISAATHARISKAIAAHSELRDDGDREEYSAHFAAIQALIHLGDMLPPPAPPAPPVTTN